MKKTMAILLACLLILLSGCNTNVADEDGKSVVVASFYPVYIFTLNLVDGIEDIEVCRLAEQNTGCLHDYTLTAKDAKLLNDAELLVINGAGMESFVEDLYKTVDTLSIVDSSEGIDLICEEGHGDEDSHEEHNHSHGANSHIWLSVENAKKQVLNIKNGLIENYPQHEKQITSNYSEYIKRLDNLNNQISEFSPKLNGKKVLTFHQAYDYMAIDAGFEITDCIESDDGSEPSAKKLSHLCDEIKGENIKALFTEPDYEGSAAEILSAETGAEVYVVNPVLAGEEKLTAYEEIMLENYKIICEAVS